MGSTTAVDTVVDSRSRWSRLVQKRAAAWLVVGLLTVPGLPMVTARLLTADPWTAGADGPVQLTTDGGSEVVVPSPPGWDVVEFGDGASYRLGEASIAVQAYDRDSRDLESAAERLMRTERLSGVNGALTGAEIATDDSSLSGQTCVLVGDGVLGSCAFVADDDVIVWVQILGTVDAASPQLSDVVGPIRRGQA